MLRLMAEMLKLPVALFVSGMEVMVRAMREYQNIANRALDTAVEQVRSGAEPPVDTGPERAPPSGDVTEFADGEESARYAPEPKEKETDAMINEQALGSEDTKTVRYRIIFTKRNHETTLKEEEATINYATDPMSVSGRYISDFWAGAAVGGEQEALKRLYKAEYYDVQRPPPNRGVIPRAELDRAVAPQPGQAPVPVGWTIKDEDKKYLAFRADLLDQIPRQKAEYDRERNEELRRIAEIPEEMRKLREFLDDRLP
jgi:hypothetical protein